MRAFHNRKRTVRRLISGARIENAQSPWSKEAKKAHTGSEIEALGGSNVPLQEAGTGLFYFVAGYSVVGGSDIIGP